MLLRSLIAMLGFAIAAPVLAEPLNYNLVNLQAEARREVQNDLLQVTVFVEQSDTDPARLASQINAVMNDARKTAGGYPGIKFTAGENQTFPVYDKNNRFTQWRGRAEARIECRDFKLCSALIGKLQGKLQMAQWNFSIAPETRSVVENELMAEAIAAFRQRADIASKALLGKGYKVVSLNIGSQAPYPRPMYALARSAAMIADSAPAPMAEGGTAAIVVNVQGSVQVAE